MLLKKNSDSPYLPLHRINQLILAVSDNEHKTLIPSSLQSASISLQTLYTIATQQLPSQQRHSVVRAQKIVQTPECLFADFLDLLEYADASFTVCDHLSKTSHSSDGF